MHSLLPMMTPRYEKTIDDFVTSYNNLVSTLDQLTSYNAESDLAAPLLGDSDYSRNSRSDPPGVFGQRIRH